ILARFVDRHDVGVAEACGRPGFPHKPLDPIGCIEPAGLRHFQCNLAFQPVIKGPIHRAKRAAAEPCADLKTANLPGKVTFPSTTRRIAGVPFHGDLIKKNCLIDKSEFRIPETTWRIINSSRVRQFAMLRKTRTAETNATALRRDTAPRWLRNGYRLLPGRRPVRAGTVPPAFARPP